MSGNDYSGEVMMKRCDNSFALSLGSLAFRDISLVQWGSKGCFKGVHALLSQRTRFHRNSKLVCWFLWSGLVKFFSRKGLLID